MKELQKEERDKIFGGAKEVDQMKAEGWKQTDFINEYICRNCGSRDTYYMEWLSKGNINA